jgi:sporulation protein YlmC with PRC-barrel domain
MFRSTKELFGYQILAQDGEIGKVYDLYFDDDDWLTRYLVVDTGPWILGRRVLLVPDCLGQPDWTNETFPVDLTRKQIKESPEINTALPISKQQQISLHRYYRWPPYWSFATPFSTSPVSSVAATMQSESKYQDEEKKVVERMLEANSTLRSTKEIIGYQVNGEDGELGQVNDIILDDETWKLLYLVLDTSTGLKKGKKTLIAIPWVKWFDYKSHEVQLELRQQTIENSPSYDPSTPINHTHEEVLYDYYGRPYIRKEESVVPER